MMRSSISLLVVLSAALTAAALVPAKGRAAEATPQSADTGGLEELGDEWLEANPYDTDSGRAVAIGESAYNENCARCHGLQAISGGLAPDLRYLPPDEEGDEIFIDRMRNGSTRDGNVLMPPFEDVLEQETMWAIRTWLETVYEE